MDVQEFRLLLEALGPDLGAWPAPVADAAVALMAASDAAQDLFAATSAAKAGGQAEPSGDAAALIARILKDPHGEA